MSTQIPDGRIRKRMAEIDQHISGLMKERDELIFAERVLNRLREGGSSASPKGGSAPAEIDSIEDALLKLESM